LRFIASTPIDIQAVKVVESLKDFPTRTAGLNRVKNKTGPKHVLYFLQYLFLLNQMLIQLIPQAASTFNLITFGKN